jgi:hypothetical protein
LDWAENVVGEEVPEYEYNTKRNKYQEEESF